MISAERFAMIPFESVPLNGCLCPLDLRDFLGDQNFEFDANGRTWYEVEPESEYFIPDSGRLSLEAETNKGEVRFEVTGLTEKCTFVIRRKDE